MTAPATKRRYTYNEYLVLERTANVKHEFHAGEIYGMAGGTREHAALAANVIGALARQIAGKPRQVHSSDLRIRVPATGLATYADATVVCDRAEMDPEDRHTVINPTVVVEVTSPSTEDYDREEKLEHYRRIPSLRTVVIVSHRERCIEIFARGDGDSWMRSEARAGDAAVLASIDASLAVDEVYRDALSGEWLA
ncbi:MAG: Uma2 family endonuclease [Sandaracinaceae bacterium]